MPHVVGTERGRVLCVLCLCAFLLPQDLSRTGQSLTNLQWTFLPHPASTSLPARNQNCFFMGCVHETKLRRLLFKVTQTLSIYTVSRRGPPHLLSNILCTSYMASPVYVSISSGGPAVDQIELVGPSGASWVPPRVGRTCAVSTKYSVKTNPNPADKASLPTSALSGILEFGPRANRGYFHVTHRPACSGDR